MKLNFNVGLLYCLLSSVKREINALHRQLDDFQTMKCFKIKNTRSFIRFEVHQSAESVNFLDVEVRFDGTAIST